MNTKQIEQACRDSVERNKPFPEVLAVLADAGVERYHADLVQCRKTYYSPEGETAATTFAVTLPGPVPARANMVEVRAAISAIQGRQLGYVDFLRRILAAGITDYFVYLAGKRAVYVDRAGESHIEKFPQ